MMTSQSSQRKPRYIYELPYLPHRDLARILDDNNQWKDLGGVYLNYDVTTLNAFGRTDSPTSTMLSDWGQKNHTVTELFVSLSRMHHYRALEVLKPYVDEQYHVLINEGEMSLTRLLRPDQGAAAHSSPRSKLDPPSITVADKYPSADACNFNLQESGRSLTSKKLINFGDSNQNPPSQPIAIGNQSNNNTVVNISKSDNLQVSLDPSPKAVPLSPQLGPVNSPKFRRDSDSSACSDFSSASAMSSIPPIDEAELAAATNQWSSVSILGKGGFGTVYKGMWKNTQVAIKRMENKGLAGANIIPLQQSMGELRILNAVRHDNILPLYGYSLGGDFPCLVYQFMPNGSLEDRLLCRQAVQPLTWEQRLNVARGTARGLQFLHTMSDKPLIHGDIKSANILLDKNFEPKIGDFGLAREGPQTHYTHIKVSRVHGTRPYLPDEYLRGRKISTKVDTYSFGIVLYELGSGLRAYDHLRVNHYLKDHVENSDCNLLRDLKAGQECVALYLPLMHIGSICSATNPKDRPEMVKVLKDLDHLAMQTEEYVTRKSSLTSSSPRIASQVSGFSPPAPAFPMLTPRPVLLPTIQSDNSDALQQSVAYADGIIPDFSRLGMPSAEELRSAEMPNLSEFIAVESTKSSIHTSQPTVSSDLSSELPSSDEDYRQPQSEDSVSSVPTREKTACFFELN